MLATFPDRRDLRICTDVVLSLTRLSLELEPFRTTIRVFPCERWQVQVPCVWSLTVEAN
ncbi:hypothetical protein D3C86_2239870 [compost metagenome]